MFKLLTPVAGIFLASALLVNPLLQAKPAQAVTQAEEEIPIEEVVPTSLTPSGTTLTKETVHKQLPSSQGVVVYGNLNTKTTRVVDIQQLNAAGEWVTVSSTKTVMNSIINARLPKVEGMKPVTFRIYVPAIEGYSDLTTAPQIVQPYNITASLEWTDVVDDRNKLDASTGFTGNINLTFSQLTNDSVGGAVKLLNSKDGGATWNTVSEQPVATLRLSTNFTVKDVDHYLSSGKVLYKAVFVPKAGVQDLLSSPVESTLHSVNYAAAQSTAILNATLTGKTLSQPAGKAFIVTGTVSPVGSQVVYLEEYDAKTKTWKQLSGMKSSSRTGSFAFNIVANPVAQTLRFNVEGTKAFKAASTPATLVNRPLDKTLVTQIKQSNILDKSVPWVSKTFTYQPKYVEGKITVTLQKLVNNKWVNVSAKTYNTKPNSFDVTTPKGNANTKGGTTTYRVHVSATKYNAAGASGNFNIVWENPNHYTGYKKTAYDYAKKYCGNILVNLDSSLVSKKSSVWGKAYMGKDISVIWTKIPAKHLKTVMLHECGHHKQWQLYKSDWKNFLAKTNKIYGQKGDLGMEQNADCIANYWAKNSYYGYKGDCKGAKGTAGRLIATGKKL